MSAPTNTLRPRTRGECVDGPRPCPWVSCRHHLLLEIRRSRAPKLDEHGNRRDVRPTTIVLNRATGNLGSRPGLAASAPAEIVRAWIRDALEHLDAMEFTCALDVADAHADGYPLVDVAGLLGVTTAALKEEVGPTGQQLRNALREYEDHAPADQEGNLARVGGRR